MDTPPSDEKVAEQIKISVEQVEQYRDSSIRRADGLWVITFRFDMPQKLRHHLTGSFSLVMPGE